MQHTKPIPESFREIDQDTLRMAAILLAATEANNRPEPAQAAPEIAALLRARKPSDIPQKITQALINGLFLEAEIFARKADIVLTLTRSGLTQENAEEFFMGQLYSRKWAAITREAAR